MIVTPFPSVEPVTNDGLSPEYSDDALALEFSSRHANELRYCLQWGAWLLWDGARWKFENTLKAFDMARSVAREFANACHNPADRPKIASAGKVAAIERLARSDRRHATETDLWDTDPWLLNTPRGIVVLRTGKILPHDPDRYITKITAVAPGGQCPLWRRFLEEITAKNDELQQFLQRTAGYCLTASTREHALFFAYGTGGNGKGVFLNTLAAILADYAAVAPMETFIAVHGERHPTDLAGLRGARLVTSQETEEGRRWAESKIKALTGGDPITARFMRQDFFTYTPAFKLVIAGNHKPGLRGVDEAIRRRFHLLPFLVTITNPDPDLPEKLKAEWPGILQWMIQGCLMWQRDGLSPPPIVREATESYLAEEDGIARWIEECCNVGKQHWCASKLLWPSWQRWATAANEVVGSRKRFSSALESHGYLLERTMATRGYRGLDLIPTEPNSGEGEYADRYR
jgi:P4 family phage/plasmid primase-like protien